MKRKNQEIADGFGEDAEKLFKIPENERNTFGRQIPRPNGEKYVKEWVKLKMKFSSRKVARMRKNIINGKSTGYYDKVPGEIIKYAVPFEVSDIDRALNALWCYIYSHDNSYPSYYGDSTLTMSKLLELALCPRGAARS